MKRLIAATLIILSSTAFAYDGNCVKLASLEKTLDEELNLSRYSLGMISLAEYKHAELQIEKAYRDKVWTCETEVSNVNPDRS